MKILHIPFTNSYLEFVFFTWKFDSQASSLIREDSQETDISHQLTIKLTWVDIMTYGDEFNAFQEYTCATKVRNQNDKIIRWQKVLAFKQKCLNKTVKCAIKTARIGSSTRHQNTFYQIREMEFEANTLSCHSPANIPVELSLLNNKNQIDQFYFSFFYRLKRNQTLLPLALYPRTGHSLSSCIQNLLAGLCKLQFRYCYKTLLL